MEWIRVEHEAVAAFAATAAHLTGHLAVRTEAAG
jgi:hypothetical protein